MTLLILSYWSSQTQVALWLVSSLISIFVLFSRKKYINYFKTIFIFNVVSNLSKTILIWDKKSKQVRNILWKNIFISCLRMFYLKTRQKDFYKNIHFYVIYRFLVQNKFNSAHLFLSPFARSASGFYFCDFFKKWS